MTSDYFCRYCPEFTFSSSRGAGAPVGAVQFSLDLVELKLLSLKTVAADFSIDSEKLVSVSASGTY